MTRFPRDESRWTVPSAGSPWLNGGTTFGIVSVLLRRRRREPDEPDRVQLILEHDAEEDRGLSAERVELEH